MREHVLGLQKGRGIKGLVLASASPRRKALLEEVGYRFAVVAPPLAEPDLPKGLAASRRAEALAYFKARAVLEAGLEGPVLGADTVVAVAGRVIGKPADEAEARTMLRMLSGTRHEVITGIALLWASGRRLIGHETTFVTMREISAAEVDEYIASREWVGKAGAYAIQETADRFVVRVEGSFSNVVGLPLELLRRLLGEPGSDGRAC